MKTHMTQRPSTSSRPRLRKRFAGFLALLWCLLVAFPASAQLPGIPNNFAGDSVKDKFDAEVEKHFEERKLPGLVVLYARDGLLTYKKSMGHSDVKNDVKMTEHRVGRLNSVSKLVAGIISLQQVEKGNLNLMSSAKSYLPDLPAHHTYNIRDLLACRSGVRHYGETVSPQSPTGWSNNHFDSATDAAPMFWLDPLASSVGWYHYSTHGYTILGAAIEQATDRTIADIIRTDLNQKFNLPTFAAEDIEKDVPQRMKLYKWRGAGNSFKFGRNIEIERDDPSWKVLGGGIESSPLDLLKLGILLGDGKIISQENLKKMMTRVDPLESYALGVSHSVENGYQVMAKSGSYEGSNAYMWLVPERRMVMVVMANRDEADVSGLGKTLRSLALAADKAAGQKPDLVVQDFERTAAPQHKDGKWEIPVRFKVVNQGKSGVNNSFVNGVQIGTTYRWSGFMDPMPPNGASKTVTAVVKIPDANKLYAGRTFDLVAWADAPIAAADTSIPSFARVDESSEANNKATLSVKLPGGLDLTGPAPNNVPSQPGTSNPQRVTGNPQTTQPGSNRVPQRTPSVEPEAPSRVPPRRTPSQSTEKPPMRDSSTNRPSRIPARPAAAVALADLTIHEIRMPKPKPQTVHVIVKNDGTAAANASVLRLTIRKINGAAVARTLDANVPALAPGKTTVIVIDAASLLPNNVDLKDTTFRLDADATSVVNETDETNNLKWHNQ